MGEVPSILLLMVVKVVAKIWLQEVERWNCRRIWNRECWGERHSHTADCSTSKGIQSSVGRVYVHKSALPGGDNISHPGDRTPAVTPRSMCQHGLYQCTYTIDWKVFLRTEKSYNKQCLISQSNNLFATSNLGHILQDWWWYALMILVHDIWLLMSSRIQNVSKSHRMNVLEYISPTANIGLILYQLNFLNNLIYKQRCTYIITHVHTLIYQQKYTYIITHIRT